MGIILLPFLLVALIFSIVAIIHTIELLKNKAIGSKELLLGFLWSCTMLSIITIYYVFQAEVYAWGPMFRIPTVTIFIPFAIYLLAKITSNKKVKYFSHILLISIGFSCVLGVVYFNILPSILEWFRIEKTY